MEQKLLGDAPSKMERSWVSERFRQNEALGSVKSLDVYPLFCITCATNRPRRQEEEQLRAAGAAAPAAESRAASAPKAATAAKAQAPKAAKAAQVGTSFRDDGRMMAE
jgi:hypothetical protein